MPIENNTSTRNNALSHIEDLVKSDLTQAVKMLVALSGIIDARQTDISLLCSQWNDIVDDFEKNGREGSKVEENRIRRGLLSSLDELKSALSQQLDFSTLASQTFHATSRTEMIRKVLEQQLRAYYTIDDLPLSEGNSTISFCCTSHLTGRKVIAMVLKVDHLTPPLKAEIDTISRLKHRNIIKMMSGGPEASIPLFLLTEYVNGPFLSVLMEKVGPRPTTQATNWLIELMDALDYMRQKQVRHSNIRPSKIFIDEEQHPMISPFDIIKWGADGRTLAKFIEDCRYACPEKLYQGANEDLSLDAMFFADQYSLGLVAYYILTGQDLFTGSSIPAIIHHRDRFASDKKYRAERLRALPNSSWVRVIDLMLQENPQKRYPNLRKLQEEIEKVDAKIRHTDDLARISYRRCLSSNKEFIRDFYRAFFKKTADDNIASHFNNLERQQAMFQMAVDVMIDIDHKKDYLKGILLGPPNKNAAPGPENQNPHIAHAYTLRHYEQFLDTLIELVERTEGRGWNADIADAWARVREKNLAAIRDLLSV